MCVTSRTGDGSQSEPVYRHYVCDVTDRSRQPIRARISADVCIMCVTSRTGDGSQSEPVNRLMCAVLGELAACRYTYRGAAAAADGIQAARAADAQQTPAADQ